MYYYVYNLQGDVTHIMKGDKTIAGTYQYDAWGKITNLTSLTAIAQINPFRYRGYYYDSESGLYYLNSRYYNPEWGRFINADGILGETGHILSYNLYAYCFDNPVLLTDSDGTCPYNGTAADFHRLEQGLPSLTCTCSTPIGNGISFVSDTISTGIDLGLNLGKHSYLTAECPKNIGKGVFNKQVNNALNSITSCSNAISKASLAVSAIAVAASVGEVIYMDYYNGSTTKKIIWDAAVEMVFGCGSILAPMGVAAIAGAVATGPAAPFIIIGVGLGSSIIYNAVTDDWKEKAKGMIR